MIDTQPRSVHFLGICGTAMGSVAAAMKERGIAITGSDEAIYPPMSDFLRSHGIEPIEGFHPGNLPKEVSFVIIGNAMKRGNPEVEEVLNRKLPYLSLPEALKFFFLRDKHNLVVTGTHGKTTTTSMLAWIFESAGKNPSYLIGGIPANLGAGCRLLDSKHCILEGDEYDTAFFDKRSKFVHYLPELVIINNIEFDHADIFRNLDEICLSFERMLRVIPNTGMVLVNADDPVAVRVSTHSPAPVLEVGFSQNAGNQIREARQEGPLSRFTLFGEEFELPMIGEFNIRNAAMAASAAHFYQIPVPDIRRALATFQGVKRRQEIRGVAGGVTVVDDFGHHPTAIRQTLTALRKQYPHGKLWAVFEPRSNTTRRAVFQKALPEALAGADGIFLAQVAKLEQIPEEERLRPEKVVDDLRSMGKIAEYEPDAKAITESLVPRTQPGDVIVVFSNGGFGGIHGILLESLSGHRA